MPATVRDLLLLIRTKEDASRAINNIAQSMRRAGAAADAASLRAQAAQKRSAARQAHYAGATRATVLALQNQARAFDKAATSVEINRKRQVNLGHAMQGVARTAQLTGATMIALGGASIFALKGAVDSAVAWDKQVRLTYTQVDKRLKPSLAGLSAIGLRVARDVAVPFEKIQDALFDVFSSTEANLPQAEALLRSFSKAAVAGNTDIQIASRATIGLMNAYQIPFKDVNKILDIQFQLVQEGVGTYEEWAQRIGLVTPSAVRAGQSIETMAAALATATRLGTSAARAGTAVARGFDAMSNPKTEQALANIGVKTRDARGNFRPLVDVLTDWRKELEKLPKKDRIESILDTLKGAGSTIEARRFLQNMLLTKGGLELFQDQIKEFANDKGAFEAAYNQMSQSVAAKTELLRNAWMTLKVTIGEALLPTFITIVSHMQKLLDKFNALSPQTKSFIAQAILWGSVLAIVSGAITILVGGLVGLASVITIAGSALLPMLGAFAAVAAAAALLIAGIVALGVAFYRLYQSSEQFRSLLNTIKIFAVTAFNALRESAMRTYEALRSSLGPGLSAIWAVIQTKVVPAMTTMVNWLRNNLIPAAQAAWQVFLNQVKPALDQLGNTIKNTVAPALSDLVDWWNKNKESILPVIKFLGTLMVTSAAVAGTIVGALVAAIALSIRNFVMMARIIKSSVTVALAVARASINTTIAVIKAIINWFKNFGTNTATAMNVAKNAVLAGINAIKGFFSGAGSWLISAGRDMIMGLVNGIRGAIGAAADAAASVASNAIAAAKSALKISSPSKVFKDIGANVVRGFVLGITGNRKKIQNVLFALRRDVNRAISDSDVRASSKRQARKVMTRALNVVEKQLLSLEGKRATLQTKLANATKSYNDQLARRNDLAEKIRDSLNDAADITSLDDTQKASSAGIVQGMQARLQALKDFQYNLLKLQGRGFDTETIAEIATKGVEAGGALAATLANASQNDLNVLAATQQQIRAISGSMGNSIADSLYKAGIDAAKGLMDGLNSQINNITKQMTKIANALVAAIKKQLGIRSPSTVFANIGRNTALGYINGYVQNMDAAKNRMALASMFNPVTPLNPAYGTPQPTGDVPQKTVTQYITVNTQEIDPRKHAAELGWELQGRV